MDKYYTEYITQDRKYKQVCSIPEEVAHLWLRCSEVFKSGELNTYVIGDAALDPNASIRWMNKGAIRIDDTTDSYNETWLYKHDFTYWVCIPR